MTSIDALLEKLDIELCKNKIKLFNDKIVSPFLKAFAMKSTYNSKKIIVVDNEKIIDKHDYRCTLEHEITHLENDYLYHYDDDLSTKKLVESKVEYLTIKRIVPFHMLKQLLQDGYNNYEIAEKLSITLDVLDKAYIIYESVFLEDDDYIKFREQHCFEK